MRSICAVVVVSLMSLCSQVTATESTSVRFKHISRDQGLSASFVYSIVQDDEGYMWFGTLDGLNRFDGFDFTVFAPDPEDPNSISDESIRAMISDSSGTLWIGTDAGGLSRYDRATQSFRNFTHDPQNPDSISDNRVRSVYEDSAGTIWVGTDGSGLDRFSRDTETFTHYPHNPDDPASLASASVWSILETADGTLFVATDGGLSQYDPDTDTFVNYRHDPSDPSTLNNDRLRVLFEDADGNFWVGTDAGGLDRFDRASGTFQHFVHDPANATSISANRINAVYQDSDGKLWVGTIDGLNEWHADSQDFTRHVSNAGDRFSLSHNNVSSIYQDQSGVLWIGTLNGLNLWNQASRTMLHYRNNADHSGSLSENMVMSFAEGPHGDIWVATYGGGLNRLDRSANAFQQLRHLPGDDSSLSSDLVTSVLVDKAGVLWAGTRSSGLNRHDAASNSFTRFRHDADDPSSISADGVTHIIEDSTGTLWVATFGGGLNRFDSETQTFSRLRNNPDDADSLSSDRVLTLFEDSQGDIWIGTYGGGLNHFDQASGTFTTYRSDPGNAEGLSGDEIYMIQEDVHGDIWIGVKGMGLNRWRRVDRERGKQRFQKFTNRDGLPSTTIYSGVWDQSGHLWMSTGHGLSKLNVDTLEFKNYDTSHGLQDDEFNLSAGIAATNGQLFFGGVNGFNAFFPDMLGGDGKPPPVAITKLQLLNDTVNPETLNTRSERVELEHDQNVIGFEFVALDFVAPEKNRYKYMLEGFDEDWTDAGAKRQVTYMNLPAGEYRFRVIASNADGVWNETGAAFDIAMKPAFWRTWWAYLVYFLVFVAVAGLLLRANAKRVRQAGTIKHAEEIALVHERMRDAQKIAHIGNWELDARTRELWWSDEIYRIFGVDQEKVGSTYELFLELVHPDDREEVNDAVMSALAGPEPYAIDHRIIRPDGTERIMHSHAQVFLDENGAAIRMAGTVHDITERKRAEAEIQHKADYQAMLAEISSNLISARSKDIDDRVARSLELISTTFDLDVVSIWWAIDEEKHVLASHNWERGKSKGQVSQVLRADVPWIYEQLSNCDDVIIDDVSKMPDEAARDRDLLQQRGRKSALIVPLRADRLLEGACAFATTKDMRAWSDEVVAELRLAAENLGVALARLRAIEENERLKEKLQEENLYLRDKIKLAHGFDEIVGEDPLLRRCLMAVEKVAPTSVPVLILGETGTGKELIARAVHKLSPRRDKPMVSVNCPALPAELIESELFGHEAGAFTGAQSQRRGRFELADTGTIFLDEIGELPLELQSKLLRVLQTGDYERLGGTETLHTDVRVLAATNRDLKHSIEQGEFRSDLFYRISSFPIDLPALRDRKEDIALLAEHFVQKHAPRLGRKVDAISARMIRALTTYEWPGNIRELESTIERALISMSDSSVLELPDSLPWVKELGEEAHTTTVAYTGGLVAVDRAYIIKVLEHTGWKIAGADGAAALLGMPPSTLRSKMQRLGITR